MELQKSNPKMHSSWMSAIHMGCTASCDPILTWRLPLPCMGAFSPVTVRRDWVTSWMHVCSCWDSISDQMMEILLPVCISMVIWQGCSSTLPATSRFSDPCNTPVSKFSVGACVKVAKFCPTSSATDSVPDPTQGWQQQGVYSQWIVSCTLLQQVGCFCEDLQGVLLV